MSDGFPERNEPEEATLEDTPFDELIRTDAELSELRTHHAKQSAAKRLKAAQWAYDSGVASHMVGEALGHTEWTNHPWHSPIVALAIDPTCAPAMLTVGSLSYQYGRVDEAMGLFLDLASLPPDADDVPECVDKAGDFLIDQDDLTNANRLYSAAVKAYPKVVLYQVGMGYCALKAKRMAEAIEHARLADELEPDNYLHLSDLGYCLTEAGHYEEAEGVLQRAVARAPPEYELASGNLEHLQTLMADEAPSA